MYTSSSLVEFVLIYQALFINCIILQDIWIALRINKIFHTCLEAIGVLWQKLTVYLLGRWVWIMPIVKDLVFS